MGRRFIVLLAVLFLGIVPRAWAVGFQWVSAPNPDGDGPLKVAVWYPSKTAPLIKQIGPFEMAVAFDAPISGTQHGLILMSHGTGGMALNSYDTAIALAQAGYVVAAVTHAGDNYLDHSVAFSQQNFTGRARQISRVLDFMLHDWGSHASIDPARVGFFGHSAGGTTGLIVAGGVGDWQRAVAFCATHGDDWGCRHARDLGRTAEPGAPTRVAGADPRIKALVIAAPALAHIFEPAGLVALKIPTQLWVGARDDVVVDAAKLRGLMVRKPDYRLIPNGGHFVVLSPCNDILRANAPEICIDPHGFDRARFLKRFQRDVVAFYRRTLK